MFVGLDGEGVRGHSLDEPNHHYILLAAVSQNGARKWWIESPRGLKTEQCLRFLVNLPKEARLFTFSFNYDLTKMLTDLDNQRLYLLFRPEDRAQSGNRAKQGPRPIFWRGFGLNLQGSKFTITYGTKKRVIWDIFKFYQAKFVNALKEWKVGNPELYERMTAMKNRRATFRLEEMEEIRNYCFEECQCMAELAARLVSAHESAGLKLTSFYGAGSSASAMLKKMGIQEKLVPVPTEMEVAVAQAFFGGRFENSGIGPVRTPCYNRDISSAYPYQTCFLPCLLHGTWKQTRHRSDLDGVRTALVRYGLRPKMAVENWAPFPYREEDGSISFPKSSPGGWIWNREYLAGEKLFPELVQFREAWIYDCECDCQPFREVPHYYRERVRIGKEGPGIVYKLGCNSLYGKLAQSIGSANFNNWIWAGLITSGCRAQILDLMGLFPNREDILMIATDGLLARTRVNAPVPEFTGTSECRKKTGEYVPLGGWEESVMERGAFMARPGIYFPLNPSTGDIDKVKGRGVGKSVVLRNHDLITASWAKYGVAKNVNVYGIERFCGAKTSLTYGNGRFTRATAGWELDGWNNELDVPIAPRRREPSYGEWIDRTVTMSFDPMPKRARILPGSVGEFKRLELRTILGSRESEPYNKAVKSAEAKEMMAEMAVILEQPDADYTEQAMWEND
jgi:hypothetical protein